MRDVIVGVGAIVVVGAVIIGGAELSYRVYQHYAPRNEEVRRETYEQSRAYQEGSVRDLENMQLAYAMGNEAEKAAIRSVALHRLADVPVALLTPELRTFRSQLMGSGQ